MNQDVSPSKPKTPELNRFSIVSSRDEEEKKLPTIVSDESEEEEYGLGKEIPTLFKNTPTQSSGGTHSFGNKNSKKASKKP